MSNAMEYCTTHNIIAIRPFSTFAGIAVYGFDYSEDRAYVSHYIHNSKTTYHKLKIYHGKKSGVDDCYIRLYDRRHWFSDFTKI